MQRHEFDPVSFVFAMAFVAIGLRLVLTDESLIRQDWLWPGFLLVSGAVLIAAAALRNARRAAGSDIADVGDTGAATPPVRFDTDG
jgi:hypothetical protein